MSRSSHPKKEVEAALVHAENNKWRVAVGGGHAWGKIYCPFNNNECRCGTFCITSVWCTPKSATNHAKDLRRVVDNCTMRQNQQSQQQSQQKPQPQTAATAALGEDDGI